jgi:hypothetical protein
MLLSHSLSHFRYSHVPHCRCGRLYLDPNWENGATSSFQFNLPISAWEMRGQVKGSKMNANCAQWAVKCRRQTNSLKKRGRQTTTANFHKSFDGYLGRILPRYKQIMYPARPRYKIKMYLTPEFCNIFCIAFFRPVFVCFLFLKMAGIS